MSATDGTTVQSRALLIAACDELLDAYDWQALLRTHTFTTDGVSSSYPLPADCQRVLNMTDYDVTNLDPLNGSLTPAQWEYVRSGINYLGSRPVLRIAGDRVELLPVTGPRTVQLQYISRNYVIDGATSAAKPEFTQDSDRTTFSDRLLINFLKLKILEVKGFDTSRAVQDFNTALSAAKSNDAPAGILSLVPYDPELPTTFNVPDRVL